MKVRKIVKEKQRKSNLFKVIALPPIYLMFATFNSCHLASTVAQCSAASPLYAFVE